MSPRRRRTQGVKVPSGLPYGMGEQLAEAQRAIPLPGSGSTPRPSAPSSAATPAATPPSTAPVDAMAAAIAAAAAMQPPQGRLLRPSERPWEPVTTGLPIGPGAGPEVLPRPTVASNDPALLGLINAYRMYPSAALGRLIEIARARSSMEWLALDEARQRRVR